MVDLLDRLRTALGERYTIDRELGRGGMAAVYLAEDLKHHRAVAIKVLHPELAAALGPERFLREIQIAAGLNHPHILPLHDSGEADGFLYYVMPYAEGESLRDRLDRECQLPIPEALQIVRQVADGLSYAHSRGLVHRDIKPENILLEHGHAVVADFGIARAVDAAGGTSLTETGIAVGTPAYMSPEQASGTGALDGRSDIYALGCILYEMLAGEPPFTGPSAQAIIARRFTEPVPQIASKRDTVPGSMQAVLDRALARVPADRFATAYELAQALEAPDLVAATSGAVTAERQVPASDKSVAVLPFSNLSPDPENEYFADGMTEEIINALAQLKDLHVAARTSSFVFKGKAMDVAEVGRQLKVGTVLEGSVRKAGSRLRITAQLISVADGFHLWSERYDRELADVFDIQDEIARAIANVLKVKLLAGDDTPLARPGTDDLQAYELHLEGRYHWYRRGEGLGRAVECFNAAIAQDPTYGAPYAGLADAFCMIGVYGYGAPRDVAIKARQAAERAVALAPELPEAHYSLGLVEHYYGWDPEAALRSFQRAIELEPRLALAHTWLGQVLAMLGRPAEATRHAYRALELEPLSPLVTAVTGFSLLAARRIDEALDVGRRAVELEPRFGPSHWLYGWALLAVNRLEEAVASFEQAAVLTGRSPLVLQFLGSARARLGDRDGASEILSEVEERAERLGYGRHWAGSIYWDLDDMENAFACLEIAVADRAAAHWALPALPGFEDVGRHPRWRALLAKHGVVIPGFSG